MLVAWPDGKVVTSFIVLVYVVPGNNFVVQIGGVGCIIWVSTLHTGIITGTTVHCLTETFIHYPDVISNAAA